MSRSKSLIAVTRKSGGQHGRWRLRTGHSFREITEPEKKKPAADSKRVSNPKSNGKLEGGINENI